MGERKQRDARIVGVFVREGLEANEAASNFRTRRGEKKRGLLLGAVGSDRGVGGEAKRHRRDIDALGNGLETGLLNEGQI